MLEAKERNDTAASLLSQFMDAGIVTQSQDGSFQVPSSNKD